MQHSYNSIVLPVAEYARLQRLMHTMIGSRSVLAAILRRKLGSAAPSGSVDPEVAVSGRRVQFRVDGRQPQTGVLTWVPPERDDTSGLSLLTPRGLALLGLIPGESTEYATQSGRTEFLAVEKVVETEAPLRDRGASRQPYPAASRPRPQTLSRKEVHS